MSKKRKIVVITMSNNTNKLFRQQLKEVLKGQVEIEGYSIDKPIIDNITPMEEIIDADLILSTKSLSARINHYVPDRSKVIFARRALDVSALERLIQLPSNKETLLIDNTKLAVLETETLLKRVGIDHINLVPYYPGKSKKSIEHIDLAINLGEKKYVPQTVETVIDIGSRTIDITTIVEILIKLDLLNEKANLLISNQIKQLVELSKRLNNNMKNVEKVNKKLDAVINHVHDGIIYINKNEEIEVFNQMAEEIFGIETKDVIGAKVEEKIPNTNLNQILEEDIKQTNNLQEVGGKNIVTTRVPVKKDNKTIGALATFKDITEVKKLEKDLRRKLKDKGHVAKYKFSNIVGESKEINQTISQAKKLAKSKSTVLIQGESGTGKELFSQAIHNYSERNNFPFVAINCAALPENLLESELFGYEGGAFTGARKDGKPGVFEQAHTGTIFLDEIGDIPLNIQTRLLRVLQEREVMRIGGTKVIPINIRVIAATNKDLSQMVKQGKFRGDLYYRLNVLSLQIPPLRNRREDIMSLINFFLKKFKREDLELSKEVISRLYNYNWEGNIRELENCVEYVTQTCTNKVQVNDLPSYLKVKKNDEKESVIKKIESKLDNLGNVEEYKFILNELYLAKQLDENMGRREIAKDAEINNLSLSSQMVRSRLKKLEECNLVKIGRGRQGTEITLEGIQVLKRMNKLMD